MLAMSALMAEMEWVYLIIAGLLEPCWVLALGRSERFRNLPWTAATVVFLAASMILLALAMTGLPVGTAYAVWTGIGAIGTLIAGIILYKEPVTWMRMLFIAMIVIGIVGIQVTAEVIS